MQLLTGRPKSIPYGILYRLGVLFSHLKDVSEKQVFCEKCMNIPIDDEMLKDGLNYLVKALKKSPAWLASAVFDIFAGYEKLNAQQLEYIENGLRNAFINDERMVVPLKFLNIGISYLKKNDKNALLEFTKEERRVFEKGVFENNRQKEQISYM